MYSLGVELEAAMIYYRRLLMQLRIKWNELKSEATTLQEQLPFLYLFDLWVKKMQLSLRGDFMNWNDPVIYWRFVTTSHLIYIM